MRVLTGLVAALVSAAACGSESPRVTTAEAGGTDAAFHAAHAAGPAADASLRCAREPG